MGTGVVKAESSSEKEGKFQADRWFPKKDAIPFQFLMSSHTGNVLLLGRATHLQPACENFKVVVA